MLTLAKPESRNHVMIPNQYTNGIKSLMTSMVSFDPRKRPSIQEIMNLPIIKYTGRANAIILENIIVQEPESKAADTEKVQELIEDLDKIRNVKCSSERLQNMKKKAQKYILKQSCILNIEIRTQ